MIHNDWTRFTMTDIDDNQSLATVSVMMISKRVMVNANNVAHRIVVFDVP